MKRNRGGARLAMGLLLGPTDARNERYEELMHNLSWNFSAAEFPSKFTLLEQGESRFRETSKHHLYCAACRELAGKSRCSVGLAEKVRRIWRQAGGVGEATASSGEVFRRVSGPDLFGSDSEPVPEMYANYFRWLETADEYFPYWGYPGQGRWAIKGVALPDKILEKVYHQNGEKIFAMYREEK